MVEGPWEMRADGAGEGVGITRWALATKVLGDVGSRNSDEAMSEAS